LIEEFHKALKTGTKAEELQLETAEGLFVAIAIKSIVALRLLDLRERVRLSPDAPAEQAGLNELERAVLRGLSIARSKSRVVAVGLLMIWFGPISVSPISDFNHNARS